jgi:hypothetical protein
MKNAIVAAVLMLGLNTGCLGPRPKLLDVSTQAPSQAAPVYKLVATVKNDSSGRGQIQVQGRLVDRQSGRTYQSAEKVDMQGREETVVVLSIDAPPGDYETLVDVAYPPR